MNTNKIVKIAVPVAIGVGIMYLILKYKK